MAKDEILTIRADTEFMNLIRSLQRKYDLSQSEVVRQLISKGISRCAEEDEDFKKLSFVAKRKMELDIADTYVTLAYRENLFFDSAKKKLVYLTSNGYVTEDELNALALSFYKKSKDCFGEIKTYKFKQWLLSERIIRIGDVD